MTKQFSETVDIILTDKQVLQLLHSISARVHGTVIQLSKTLIQPHNRRRSFLQLIITKQRKGARKQHDPLTHVRTDIKE